MKGLTLTVRMFVTSSDLDEMADKARELEGNDRLGQSLVIRDWDCGDQPPDGLVVRLVVDQDRAKLKGLMQ